MREWLLPILKYTLYAVVAACILQQGLAADKKTRRLLRERRLLTNRIAEIKRDNEVREKTVDALRNDAYLVERLLRERYGYRGPGEAAPSSTARPRIRGGRG